MRRVVTVGLLVVFEHRKLCHDKRFVRRCGRSGFRDGRSRFAGLRELAATTDFLPGDDQNGIAFLGIRMFGASSAIFASPRTFSSDDVVSVADL